MRDRCASTVFSLIHSAPAVSRFVLPSATSPATSISAGVSSSRCGAPAPQHLAAAGEPRGGLLLPRRPRPAARTPSGRRRAARATRPAVRRGAARRPRRAPSAPWRTGRRCAGVQRPGLREVRPRRRRRRAPGRARPAASAEPRPARAAPSRSAAASAAASSRAAAAHERLDQIGADRRAASSRRRSRTRALSRAPRPARRAAASAAPVASACRPRQACTHIAW